MVPSRVKKDEEALKENPKAKLKYPRTWNKHTIEAKKKDQQSALIANLHKWTAELLGRPNWDTILRTRLSTNQVSKKKDIVWP